MKRIMSFVIIVSTILFISGCGKKIENEPQNVDFKVNTNEEVIKKQTIDEFEFSNTSVIYEEKNSKFETTVTNISDSEKCINEFNIQFLDKDEKEIVVLKGFLGQCIKPGDSKVVNSYYDEDLSNASKIVYTIIK